MSSPKVWWIDVDLTLEHEETGSWDTQVFSTPEEGCVPVVEKSEYDELNADYAALEEVYAMNRKAIDDLQGEIERLKFHEIDVYSEMSAEIERVTKQNLQKMMTSGLFETQAEIARLKADIERLESVNAINHSACKERNELKAELEQAKRKMREVHCANFGEHGVRCESFEEQIQSLTLLAETYRANLIKVFSCLPNKFDNYADGGESVWFGQSDIDRIEEARAELGEGKK